MSLIIHKLNVEAISCVLLGFMSLSTIFQSSQGSVFGCNRINTQFKSTVSLCYQVPDPQSHYTQYTVTEATSPSPTHKVLLPNREQLVPLLTTLVCSSSGSNPVPSDLIVDTQTTALLRLV